jgi:predicted DNA-binding transcriptional regulator YafY
VNRTDRLYSLVEELRAIAPRPRSARWLAARFDVSSRTIERDLAALQASGVPIWAEPGRTGGYCLDSSHTLAPLGFTVDEALAIMISLEMLAPSPFSDAATTALRKVIAVTQDRNLAETVELATRIYLLSDGPAVETPAALSNALQDGRVLRIVYQDRQGANTIRDVEPMGYIGRGHYWYLVAWCRLRHGIRAFRGDRIIDADSTEERATPRSLRVEDLDIPYGDLRRITQGDT